MSKIIIIGSGIGGLVAGNYLAKKGHDVIIFESNGVPGGYTSGFRRKGFYFESGTLSFEMSSLVFRIMKDLGLSGSVQFVRQKTRFLSEDFDLVPETYSELKDMYYSAYPPESERLGRYFAEVDPMYMAAAPFMTEAGLFAKLKAALHGLIVFKKYKDVPLGRIVDRYFEKGSKLSGVLKSLWYPDMAAWMSGGAIASILHDYWTVKGGMQAWADALVGNFKKSGGKVMLNYYVDRIIVRDGTATGVTSKGTSYNADYVIADCDYKKLYLKLLDGEPAIRGLSAENIKIAAVSEGVFTVYLGLNIPNSELGQFVKVPHVAYFDIRPGMDINAAADVSYFEKVAITLYSPSLVDPALSPEGKSSLMIQAMAPGKWMGDWGGGDAGRYKELKSWVKDSLIEKALKVIPGLRGMIELEDSASPITYERYTHNSCGATSSWSWDPTKKFYKSAMGCEVRTPVNNLYLGSAWSSQFGGVPGAIMAALRCVKKIKT